MKKLIAVICTLGIVCSASAQKGFQKDHLFTGGNVNLGFSSGQTAIGIGPHFGYSLNKYVDVALSLNYNYISQRDNIVYGDKLRQSVIGPGIFTRLYPVKFLFAHAQYEQNFVKLRYIPLANSGFDGFTDHKSAGSFLIGPGYAGGRGDNGNTYYYISVLFDVAGNENSPYVDDLGRTTPIIRVGFNIGLFEGKSANRGRRSRRM